MFKIRFTKGIAVINEFVVSSNEQINKAIEAAIAYNMGITIERII